MKCNDNKNFSYLSLKGIFFIILLAIILKVFYFINIVSRYGNGQYSDFLFMQQLAESLATGKGFTINGQWIFNQSAGYPLFMAIFYNFFGININIIFLLNVLLGVISTILVYLFSLYLFKGYKNKNILASIAAFLAAVYPDSLLYMCFFSSENLLVPLILAIFILLVNNDKMSIFKAILIGILAAMTVTVKAYALLLFLFVPIIFLIYRRRVFLNTFLVAITAFICLIPWTYINYKASSGRLVPFTATSGTAFLDGTNPKAAGRPTNLCYLSAQEEAGHDEIELNKLRMQKAISYIKTNPIWYIKLIAKKFLLAFSPVRDYMFQDRGEDRFFNKSLSLILPSAFNLFIIITIILGIIISFRNRRTFIIGISLFITPLLLQVIFFAYSRYRFPFLYALLPFAGLGIVYLVNKYIKHESINF